MYELSKFALFVCYHYYPHVGVSSEGMVVVLCVCVSQCVSVCAQFFILAVATFCLHMQETSDLFGCCKMLSSFDRCLFLSS